jgi:hypothetical protein
VANRRGRYLRPSGNLDFPSFNQIFGNGTSAQPWNNYFVACRDGLWSPGDYALLANLGGRFVYVTPSYVVQAIDTQIWDESNLIRFKHYDPNFQTLLTAKYGFWLGIASDNSLAATAAVPEQLTGWNLFVVYPPPRSLPCDWAGPAC